MSCLPLYNLKDLPQKEKILQDKSCHAGLLFDKFCDTWPSISESDWKMGGDSKLKWINNFIKQRVGKRPVLRESVKRLMWLVSKRCGRAKIFKSEYGFVTGLGRSHPVENGFTWHPVLGTPYLPGSSIKGLVRSWAKGTGSDEETLKRLLGSPSKIGSICFLDAIPTEPVCLKADVMTPHYANWDEKTPPGDWCSPTPIPFLVMEKQTSLLFGIIPHGAVKDGDLDKVMDWLQGALAQSGGGAKTAVGYGRFGYNEEDTDEWHKLLNKERKEPEARKNPEEHWRFVLEGQSEENIYHLVRQHLEKDRSLIDNVKRCAFVKVVLLDYKQWVCKWKSGKKHDQRKTKPGRQKLKECAKLLTDEAKACGFSAQLQ